MADEGDLNALYDEARDAMEKAVDHFKKELKKVRTGRASTSLLDGLMAEYFGTPTPLNQLATLSAPDPRLIVISPFDKSAIAAIERAIHASDLGVTPTNDGKVIRLAIPPLTEERRKNLVKQVKKIAEEHKVRVRDARRDSLSMLKELEGDGLAQDDRHRAEKKIQDLTDDHGKKIDELTAQKEKEVLEV